MLIFTHDEGVIDRIKAANSYSFPLFEASMSIRNIGVSLVDNHKKRELAYIAVAQWVLPIMIEVKHGFFYNLMSALDLE